MKSEFKNNYNNKKEETNTLIANNFCVGKCKAFLTIPLAPEPSEVKYLN
jgi:hypothetical protein